MPPLHLSMRKPDEGRASGRGRSGAHFLNVRERERGSPIRNVRSRQKHKGSAGALSVEFKFSLPYISFVRDQRSVPDRSGATLAVPAFLCLRQGGRGWQK